MSEDFALVAPSGKILTELQAVQAAKAEASPPLTPEQIAAVDAAFTSGQQQDLAAAMLTLWLNGPFLLELAREHFPGREKKEEEEEPREKPEG